MSIGVLILGLWLTVAAAYLIWQFAMGSLADEEQTELARRAPAGFDTRPAAREPRQAFAKNKRQVPIPVVADRVAGFRAHRPRRMF